MKTKTFFEWQQVGFQLESLEDAINARRKGFYVCDNNGVFMTYSLLDENDEQHELSDEEFTARITQALESGEKIWAAFDIGDAELTPKGTTMMGSDFHVGQTLFFMDNNNICKSKLTEIILSISTESQQEEYVLNNDKEVWRRTKSTLFLSKDELIQSLLDNVKE